ncbi:hypothetical protein CHS0354_032081 [Potamilus streckersoni]|uniref:Uncharacterized protein n=1 Tax=Potamilus streckersoni TaxID=2493646 RepID=A0AAE0WFJ8_9BIVA|nr:hypothetical protein CHS0354_032081 [Potamilus streckersoni]
MERGDITMEETLSKGAEEDLDISLEDINQTKVRKLIKALENRKDFFSRTASAQKLKSEETQKIPRQMFQNIWQSKETISECKIKITVNKGGYGHCNNWRCITVLSFTI